MIWAFVTSLISSPTILAIGAAFIAAMGWGFNQRVVGARKERAKQAASEAKARDVADEIDDAVAGRTPAENRERLRQWSRK